MKICRELEDIGRPLRNYVEDFLKMLIENYVTELWFLYQITSQECIGRLDRKIIAVASSYEKVERHIDHKNERITKPLPNDITLFSIQCQSLEKAEEVFQYFSENIWDKCENLYYIQRQEVDSFDEKGRKEFLRAFLRLNDE